MSEIAIYFLLKRDALLPAVITSAMRNVFDGYFTPHTAAVRTVSGDGMKIKRFFGHGGFADFVEAERTPEDVNTPWFRLLGMEIVDVEHCWTTVDLPTCMDSIDALAPTVLSQPYGELTIYGNLRLLLRDEDDHIRPRWLFRELMSRDSIWSLFEPGVSIGGQQYLPIPLLGITMRTFPHQPEYTSVTIVSGSYVWLEHQDAFRGMARATAAQNTEILAGKVRDLVVTLGDYVDDVALGLIEGMEFGAEVSRIVPLFMSTVPGLTRA